MGIRLWIGHILLELVEDAMTERRKSNLSKIVDKRINELPIIDYRQIATNCDILSARAKIVEDQCARAADLTRG